MSIYFDIFYLFWSLFDLSRLILNFSIINCTRFNWFRCDHLKSGFKFWSKMLIKRQFDHDINWFGDLDQLDCLSLVNCGSDFGQFRGVCYSYQIRGYFSCVRCYCKHKTGHDLHTVHVWYSQLHCICHLDFFGCSRYFVGLVD